LSDIALLEVEVLDVFPCVQGPGQEFVVEGWAAAAAAAAAAPSAYRLGSNFIGPDGWVVVVILVVLHIVLLLLRRRGGGDGEV